jgi:hypothetical protein
VRPEAALASRKLTRDATGGQPTHRKSLCLVSFFFGTMNRLVEKATLAKFKKLGAICAGLQNGEDYPITRLTILKSLCADRQAAAQFALHVAKLAAAEATRHARPRHLKLSAWRQHKAHIVKAVGGLESYVNRSTASKKLALYDALASVQDINHEYQPYRWGQVRIIRNRHALIVENSLRCVMSEAAEDTGFWAYHAARAFAEQYDPQYGTGLIPESAPMMEEIVRFWREYYRVDL